MESDIDSGMMAVDREARVEELLPADHPLREAPHLLATRRVDWYPVESGRGLRWRAAEQAARALRGEWLDPVVNPSVHG